MKEKDTDARIGVISAITRPVPPKYLTDEQADTWRVVVDRMPADWFPRETHAILAQYCRHAASARCIADLIKGLLSDNADSEYWIGDYDRLLRMQEREGRAMSSLATKMRITQQARINYKKKTGPTTPLPWKH